MLAPMNQQDLFGSATIPAYTPKPEHVRNHLADLLAQMRAAQSWPWEEVVVELHVGRTVPYLCGLIADPAEAEDWRQHFAAEQSRLSKTASIP